MSNYTSAMLEDNICNQNLLKKKKKGKGIESKDVSEAEVYNA